MPSSPAAITVHGQQPSRSRSTIQTRRHSSPQSPSTGDHQDPSRATTAVLVHRPCPMPTRHRVRHQHHDQLLMTSSSFDVCLSNCAKNFVSKGTVVNRMNSALIWRNKNRACRKSFESGVK
ncbi:unnamed protein product [Pleuronectes platessa]|uniref:Uncharacterized protein n=1 Tax=Pleuronectes platessa TaxID=8262 RepID=A0A9N7TJ46_PLEPL|nr:unnamed protein product [Pleuronectes platessa]